MQLENSAVQKKSLRGKSLFVKIAATDIAHSGKLHVIEKTHDQKTCFFAQNQFQKDKIIQLKNGSMLERRACEYRTSITKHFTVVISFFIVVSYYACLSQVLSP